MTRRHNLYGLGGELFALGGQPVPPKPLFDYLPNGAPPVTAEGILEFHVGFEAGYDPTWTWDGGTGTWKRSVDGVPQTVVGGAQIAPANVVIQFTPYSGEAEAQTVGEGDAWIFSDGTVRAGRWVRPDKGQPARYVDAAGATIPLRPGRTWVDLLPAGGVVDLVRAPPPATTLAPVTTVPPTTVKKKK